MRTSLSFKSDCRVLGEHDSVNKWSPDMKELLLLFTGEIMIVGIRFHYQVVLEQIRIYLAFKALRSFGAVFGIPKIGMS